MSLSDQPKPPKKLSLLLIILLSGVLVVVVFLSGFLVGIIFSDNSISLTNFRYQISKNSSLEIGKLGINLETEVPSKINDRNIEPQGNRSIESYCNCDVSNYKCEDFASPMDAEQCFIQCGGSTPNNLSHLDEDGDLFVCETK